MRGEKIKMTQLTAYSPVDPEDPNAIRIRRKNLRIWILRTPRITDRKTILRLSSEANFTQTIYIPRESNESF
jgi:hypothetical protein